MTDQSEANRGLRNHFRLTSSTSSRRKNLSTTYSGRLKRARKNASLSQSELARRIGKPAQSIQYLEDPRNAAQGSKETSRIAQECGVDAVWLSSGKGSMLVDGVPESDELAGAIRMLKPEVQEALADLVRALTRNRRSRI